MYLEIKCHSCNNSWKVYPNDFDSMSAMTCPNCREKIDRQTFGNQIIPGFTKMLEASQELIKDNLQYGGAKFTINYIGKIN